MSGSSRGRSRVPRRARRACPARRARVRIGHGPGSSRPCASGSATRVLLRPAYNPRRPLARLARFADATLVGLSASPRTPNVDHRATCTPSLHSSTPRGLMLLRRDLTLRSPRACVRAPRKLRLGGPCRSPGMVIRHCAILGDDHRRRWRALGCQRRKTRQVLCPPKPNEFEMPISTCATRAWLAM
jgi:hypothetical protein